MKKKILLLLMALVGYSSFAINDTLYLNRDTVPVFTDTVSYLVFNNEVDFDKSPAYRSYNNGETVDLAIVNTDTFAYTIKVSTIAEGGSVVNPGDTIVMNLSFASDRQYRIYVDETRGRKMGASSIISVGNNGYNKFYWNLFDVDFDLNDSLLNYSFEALPDEYRPDLFTINNYYYPETGGDTVSSVTGMVGDSIVIEILNSGNMSHSLHFHGYHVEILSNNGQDDLSGRIKDTFPLRTGESATVLLVPNQPGMFPVHDHSLISVTNNGVYPGGMITVLNIQ